MASEQFSLCWDNFHKNLSAGMSALLENEDLVDVTLAVEGKHFKAHKMVLSVCSPYFKELFKSNPCKHPIVFMKDVSYVAMSDLLQFMYKGEVQVGQDTLTSFIKTAEALQIRGLTGDGNNAADLELDYPEIVDPQTFEAKESIYGSVSAKRPRLSSTASSTTEGLPSQILKDEKDVSADSRNLNPEEVQFKMEPYDQHQSSMTRQGESADETLDENFDETNIDEDYSMIEAPDVDSQVGTSMEGCTEGQDSGKTARRPSQYRFIKNGYSYTIKKISNSKKYLKCSLMVKNHCKSSAVINENGDLSSLKIINEHNHPPDFHVEKKKLIRDELTMAAKTMDRSPLEIYNFIATLYPEIKIFYPYDTVKSSITKYRSGRSETKLENLIEIRHKRKIMRITHLGFSYHNSVVRQNPPVRYLTCSQYSRSGCHGRAVLPLHGTLENLKITQNHNHPPDYTVQLKVDFLNALKHNVEKNASEVMASQKDVFDETMSAFPALSKTIFYDSIRTSMRRWKNAFLNNIASSQDLHI